MHAPGFSMGSLYRVWNLCQGLTSMSHNCFVITPFNYYEDWGPLVKFIPIPVISSKRGTNISKLIYKVVRKILDIKILSNYFEKDYSSSKNITLHINISNFF